MGDYRTTNLNFKLFLTKIVQLICIDHRLITNNHYLCFPAHVCLSKPIRIHRLQICHNLTLQNIQKHNIMTETSDLFLRQLTVRTYSECFVKLKHIDVGQRQAGPFQDFRCSVSRPEKENETDQRKQIIEHFLNLQFGIEQDF